MEAPKPSPGVLEQELVALRHRVAVLETAAVQRQQVEDALHASAMTFRSLVEGSLLGILVHRNHQPLFVNQAFVSMLGYATPQDILQMETVLPLVAPQDRERLSAYCAARLRGEDVPL
jgi:PAS domain-containing protein